MEGALRSPRGICFLYSEQAHFLDLGFAFRQTTSFLWLLVSVTK